MLLTPNHRSCNVVYNLHLLLIGCILLQILAFVAILTELLGNTDLVLPGAFVLTGITSSFVELAVILCARRQFRANAFLKKSWQRLMRYALSYCVYSLICGIFLGILFLVPGIVVDSVLSGLFPGLGESLADPTSLSVIESFKYFFGLSIVFFIRYCALLIRILLAGCQNRHPHPQCFSSEAGKSDSISTFYKIQSPEILIMTV